MRSLLLALALAGSMSATVRAQDSVVVNSDSLEVREVSTWLRKNGGDTIHVDNVARAVQKYAHRFNLDPLLVVGIIGVENKELKPAARSSAGARGIMQVMPFWKKTFPDCGESLTDIDTNVCFGTRIFRTLLDEAGNAWTALLRYNGCKRNRSCRAYPTLVYMNVGRAILNTRGGT